MRAAALALGASLLAGCMPAITWSARSPDHRVIVEARASRGRNCLHITGRRPECHDGVALTDLAFTADGAHLAYPAHFGGRWTVVRDAQPGLPWDGVAAPVFSPDGARLAYAALDSGAWRVVVNDTAGERYDSLYTGSLRFDPTGRRLAYVAQRGDSAYAVVDGAHGPGWEAIAQLAFSADGARVGYLARSGPAAMLVVDGRALAPEERIAAFTLSPAGDGAAYAAMDGERWYVVEDGRRSGPFDSVRVLAYAPGGVLTWIAGDSAGERVVHAGLAGRSWDSVAAPVFSANGARWGYVAHDSTGSAIVVDGAVLARETWAGNLAIGADGSRVIWLARRGEGTVVVDERGAHPFDLLVDGTLLFLRDGRTWACLAGERRRHRLYVVVEGAPERRPFDWSENTRLAASAGGGAALRDWVAAEGELMLAHRGR